jgi:hypothetical protein
VKRGSHHSAETRELMRHRQRAHWTPERRAEHGAWTKRMMEKPGVRERIREGMRRSRVLPA